MHKIKLIKIKINMMKMIYMNIKIEAKIDRKIDQVQVVINLLIQVADGIKIIAHNKTFQIMITLIKLMKLKSKIKNIYKKQKD